MLRARIILAAAAGDPNAKIARDLVCSETIVREWRETVRGSRASPASSTGAVPGGRRTHGRSVLLPIVSTATSVPPDGHSCWSQGSIARHLRERGLAVSRSTVGRVLAEARIRPHKVRGWLNRAYDPAFWARAGAVCRLYLHPEPGTA